MINIIIVIGILFIPSINLEAEIVEIPIVNKSYDMSVVGETQVGHLNGTGWTNSGYRTVLAAHNYLAFSDLNDLQIGAKLFIIVPDGPVGVYRVNKIETVPENDTSIIAGFHDNTLVLITCAQNDAYRLVIYGEKL